MQRHNMIFRDSDHIRLVNAELRKPADSVLAGSAADREFDPTPGLFNGKCVAVTSLSPNPARWDRQKKCLQSWTDFGLTVYVVNREIELEAMSLPPGVIGIESEDVSSLYDRPVQRINALLNVGRETGLSTILINSDIEISGDRSLLAAAIETKDRLGIGVRYNHRRGDPKSLAAREPNGLDVFILRPDLIRRIPHSEFAIGKPVWDYWLPHVARAVGRKFHWIGEPLFFHELHPIGWSGDEWLKGAAIMQNGYQTPLVIGSVDFRKDLDGNV